MIRICFFPSEKTSINCSCTADTICFLVLQSRDMSRCTNEFVVNQEETQSILQKKLEIAIEREQAHAHALVLSHQVFKMY